jgi:predicted acetyltransferase
MRPGLDFEEPHAGLQDSYRDLVREFREAAEPLIPFPLGFPNDDFPSFVRRLGACARGEGLPSGFVSRWNVPHSTYWLVSDGVVVAVANLRHSLTDALRRDGGHIGYGVRPSARRRGFAGELLRCTLERGARSGAIRSIAHVQQDQSRVDTDDPQQRRCVCLRGVSARAQ